VIARPYWITAQLAIVPKPRGGDWLEDEMVALREAGIDVVVSMLEGEEAAWLELGAEESAAAHAGIFFVHFPVPDGGVPAHLEAFVKLLTRLEEQMAVGKRVGIHCHACIGRSPVVAASLLIRSGVPPREAWKQVATARGCAVPGTTEQREWVNRYIEANPS
jgi:protein-tyrosine phosphatase